MGVLDTSMFRTIHSSLRRFRYELFAVAGTVVVLWQMLLPGYVLTWDMVFGPAHVFPSFSGLVNGLPLQILIYGAGFILPMWAVQKVILVGLFFSLFYLPLRFCPLKVDGWAKYAGATFYAVNPFVYERFLAGQWGALAAYALLAPFLYFLFEIIRQPRVRTALYLALTMLLVGVFSLHVFVMTALIATAVLAVGVARRLSGATELLAHAALAGAIVGIVSLYWVAPLLMHPQTSPLTNFSEAHWSAFQTSADSLVFGNAAGNVLMLYGFWGESYPWMQSLRSPKDTPLVFIPALLALLIVVIVGMVVSLKAREARPRALVLLGIAVAAFIFSLGLAASYFHGFNLWLFEQVPFWRGFRDTEKWSMWLALAYAYSFVAGVSYIAGRLGTRIARAAQCAFLLLPLIYTFTLLGGFAGQIQPVDYPASWYEVRAMLAGDPACKALFLPWHQYYRLAFNNNLLTANTAPSFFDCVIVSGADAEIGAVGDQGNPDPSYRLIAEAVIDNSPGSVDATLALLRDQGIRYIIFTDDLLAQDTFRYPFLANPALTPLYGKSVDNPVDNSGIVLWTL